MVSYRCHCVAAHTTEWMTSEHHRAPSAVPRVVAPLGRGSPLSAIFAGCPKLVLVAVPLPTDTATPSVPTRCLDSSWHPLIRSESSGAQLALSVVVGVQCSTRWAQPSTISELPCAESTPRSWPSILICRRLGTPWTSSHLLFYGCHEHLPQLLQCFTSGRHRSTREDKPNACLSCCRPSR